MRSHEVFQIEFYEWPVQQEDSLCYFVVDVDGDSKESDVFWILILGNRGRKYSNYYVVLENIHTFCYLSWLIVF